MVIALVWFAGLALIAVAGLVALTTAIVALVWDLDGEGPGGPLG